MKPMIQCLVLVLLTVCANVSCVQPPVVDNRLAGLWKVDVDATTEWFARNGRPEHVWAEGNSPDALAVKWYEFGPRGRYWFRAFYTGEQGGTGSYEVCDKAASEVTLRVRPDYAKRCNQMSLQQIIRDDMVFEGHAIPYYLGFRFETPDRVMLVSLVRASGTNVVRRLDGVVLKRCSK